MFEVQYCFGSGTTIRRTSTDVRFAPKGGHRNSTVRCLLCAKSGHFAQQPTASFDHLVSAARFGGRSSVSHCRGSGGLILIAASLALAVAAIAAFLRD